MFGWFKEKNPPPSALIRDARKAAAWVATALSNSGYEADFTLESLRRIDDFFEEHSQNGQAVEDGLLAEQLGSRLFALGSYVGEVLIRAYGGQWQADDNDPNGEINIAVVLPKGTMLWPVQRVMKRFKNGPDDGIYAYGKLANG